MYKKITIILLSFFLLFLKISYVQAEDNSQFRFAVMGCMHLGVGDSKDYELAVEKIKERRPDFVLFLGGMVDPMVNEPVESLWQRFDRITDKLGVPVYNIFSDCHLEPFFTPKDRKVLMEKCFLDRYKKRYYSFEYKNNLFICLDAESLFLEEEKGQADREQLDFLKAAISDVVKYDNVFLFAHCLSPLREKAEEESAGADIEESAWFKVIHPIIKEKVKYVFCVYGHNLDAQRIDGVNYIFSGSPPILVNKISSFYHFLIIYADKNKCSIEIVPAKSIVIDNNAIKNKDIIATPDKILALTDRKKSLHPSQVIDALKIKPGMSILDIGAGTGLFTFYFAEALKGTGKVFATEVDPEMIKYIENKIKETKFNNIIPVCVQAEGVDPFYKQSSFDIIFFSEVYHCLLNAEDYFRELRPSLGKKKGRLYIIDFKNISDFSEVKFDDFKEVAKILISEGKRFPIFQRLEKDVQYFIKNWQGSDIPLEIRRQMILDFNRMLSDRWLWPELLDYYFSKEKCYGYRWARLFIFTKILYPRDLKLAKWLIMGLDEKGIFDRKYRNLNDTDRKQLRALNTILITGIFKTDKIGLLQDLDKVPIYVRKDRIISTLESAGYKFVREYDFLTHYYFLEFKRKL